MRLLPDRAALAGSGFFRLWTAESVSVAGTQVTLFAVPLVAALTLHATAWQMGLLGAVESAAALLFGLSAGVWADRFERRKLMLVADLIRAAVLLVIPVCYWLGVLSLGVLLAVAFVVGALSLLFESALAGYLVRLVGRDALGPANSWMQGTQSIGELIGPGVAGVFVQLIGAPVTILADAASYLVSASALVTLPKAQPEREEDEDSESHISEAIAGLRHVWRSPVLRPMALSVAHFNFCTAMFFALYVLYAVRYLGFTPLLLGLTTVVGGVGGLAASSAAGPLGQRLGMGPILVACYAIPGLAGLLVPLAGSFGRPAAVALLSLSAFCWFFCVVILVVTGDTITQSLVPDRFLGRTTATFQFLTLGIEPVGALIGGALGSVAGVRGTMLAAAIGLTASALWTGFSDVVKLRDLPAQADDDADTTREGAQELPV